MLSREGMQSIIFLIFVDFVEIIFSNSPKDIILVLSINLPIFAGLSSIIYFGLGILFILRFSKKDNPDLPAPYIAKF